MNRRNWFQRTMAGIGGLFASKPAVEPSSLWVDAEGAVTAIEPPPFVGYTPHWNATGSIIKYTSNSSFFPLVDYVNMDIVTDSRSPAQTLTDTAGSTRYCYCFDVPWPMGQTCGPHWQEVAERAAPSAADAMYVRIAKMIQAFTDRKLGNVINVSDWVMPEESNLIERVIRDLPGWKGKDEKESDYCIVVNPRTLRKYQSYITGEIDKVTDRGNLTWDGIRVIREGTAIANPSRPYAWPDGMILVAHRPLAESEREKSTVRFKFVEQMTVETMPDRDNGCYKGRIVEDFAIEINPEYGFLIVGA